jgi:hypothetical protein
MMNKESLVPRSKVSCNLLFGFQKHMIQTLQLPSV